MPHDRPSDSEPDDASDADTSPPESERSPTDRISRRNYLQAGATTALAAGAFTSGARAATTRHGISFSNVVDATDFGADPSGSSDSSGAIEDAIGESTLVVFPPGEYKIGSPISSWRDTFGLAGDGDVRFVPTDGYNDKLVSAGPDEFLFENIDIDIRADNTVTGFSIRAQSRFVVENVEFIGRGTHYESDVTNAFSVQIRDPDGTGIIRNVTAKKGSAIGRYKVGDGRVGVYCGPNTNGTLRIENCHFEEFGNNGLYCSRTPGDVKVRDSFLRNNNVSSVRLSGEGSVLKDSRIVVDMSQYTGPTDSTDNVFNTRCVWFEQAQSRFDFPAGVAIEGCELVIRDAWKSAGAVVVQESAKTVDITDTEIRVETDGVRAINRVEPSRGSGAVRLNRVSITGSAGGNEAVLLKEADNSIIRDACISAPGANRSGVVFDNASGCSVENANVAADDDRIVERNCSVSTSGLTAHDGCPINGHLANTLTIESVGDEGTVGYRFETSGDLAKERTANAGDTVDGSTATGVVAGGGQDGYRFDGELSSFEVVDGDAADVEAFVNGSKVFDGTTRTVTIKSIGAEEYVDYEVTASGSLSQGEYANSGDTVSGSTASGKVGGGWKDSYTFTGEITDFSLTSGDLADVDVYVDGERTDLAAQERTLTIDHTGSGSVVNYEVTTDGSLSPGEYASTGDTVDGSTATGSVFGWKDNYTFTGEVTRFTVTDGDPANVDVYVDGEQTGLTDLDRSVTIRSTGSEEYTAYEVRTNGTIRPGQYAGTGDTVDGSTATGKVGGGWKDSYEFAGDVTGFTVTDGDPANVDVYVDGTKQY
jgi:hypothetical protein